MLYMVMKKLKKPKVLYSVKHQVGDSVKLIDKTIKAMPPGKRLSINGNIYYETRKNRTDLKGNI